MGGSNPAATICYPANDSLLYSFQISQGSATTNLDSVKFTTTGTYTSGDVTNYFLLYNNTDNISTATTICTLPASGTGTHTCSGSGHTALSAILSASTVYYFWIVANIPSTATAGHTVAVSSLTSSQAFVSTGSVTGFSGAGGTITLNPQPGPITITPSNPLNFLCQGDSYTDSASPSGGVFSSSNPSVASVYGGDFVGGIAPGAATISYTIGGACYSTIPVTVNASLPPLNPSDPVVCRFGTLALSDTISRTSTSDGWFRTNITGLGTINFSTGLFTASSPGTVSVTLNVMGCTASTTVTIVALPSPIAISGSGSLCAFDQNTITLTDADSGGTWSSSIVTITPGIDNDGIVQAPGAAGVSGNCVTYTLPSGCSSTLCLTVNPLPAAISGCDTVCASSSCTVSDITTNGIWLSSSMAVATVDSFTGIIEGVGSGTATITYQDTLTTCYTTYPLYVYPFGPIVDSASICMGVPTAFVDSGVGGGVWSTSSTAIATVDPTGTVTGLAPGLDTIYYSIAAHGCYTKDTFRVFPLPSAIIGADSVCQSYTISLTDTTASGVWSASNGRSTIGATSGVLTGMSPGADTVYYTSTLSHCRSALTVTVHALPGTIFLKDSFCVGATDTIMETMTGGSWWLSNTRASIITTLSIAGHDACVISGLTAGVDTIYYSSSSTGCAKYHSVTVNPLPGTISGTLSICASYSTTLTDPGGGGWLGFSPGVAGVTSTGVVSGLSAGVDSIVYTLPTGCATHAFLTVNPLPATITGSLNVCVGSSVTLSDASSGTSWVSTSGTVASISGSGASVFVTGLTAGTDSIKFVSDSGCPTYAVLTVNAMPLPITSTSFTLCTGTTMTLEDATSGGFWYGGDTSIAVIDSTTGVITGVVTHIDSTIVTYSLPSGCNVTQSITVYPLPDSIDRPLGNLCQYSTETLFDLTPYGVWTTSSTIVAVVTGFGATVTGVTPGIVTITYTTATGCYTTTNITVNPLPDRIYASATSLCAHGNPVTLSDSALGGTWSSGTLVTLDPSIGVVSGDSQEVLVTGAYGGIATITYTLPTACAATFAVTVLSAPDIGYSTNAVCVGDSIIYTDSVRGGIWQSVNSGEVLLGHIDSTVALDSVWLIGAVAGFWNIAYELPNGCVVATAIIVNDTPSGIYSSVMPPYLCAGDSLLLGDASLDGSWSTTAGSTSATVNFSTGELYGLSAGMDTVLYTNSSTGCYVQVIATVNPLSPILGLTQLCSGSTLTLSDTTHVDSVYGTWSIISSGALGTVTALTPGDFAVLTGSVTSTEVDVVRYNIGATSCSAYAPITIYPAPGPITGGDSVCLGSTLSLLDETGTGVWSSSNPTVASIDSLTGLLTGQAVGIATITFTNYLGGCYITQTITVNPLPAAITGPAEICPGVTFTYTDSAAGGWISSATGVLTIDPTAGVATGLAGGISVISLTTAGGCVATKTITVTTIDSVAISPTRFPISVCEGSSIMLSDGTPGGSWSSGNTTVATVSPTTGIVYGVSSGTTQITYTVASGCFAFASVQVNPIGAILGYDEVCQYLTVALTDTTLGGIWISSDPSVATVSSAGIVTGITPGTTTIYYELVTSCTSSRLEHVIGIPIITQDSLLSLLCPGTAFTLDCAATGISGPEPAPWSSSNSGIASVYAYPTYGVVSGGSIATSGSAIITYTSTTMAGGSNCVALYPVSVNPAPDSIIMSSSSLCAWGNDTIWVTDHTPGGTWSSLSASVQDGVGGWFVVGFGAGPAVVTYTTSAGCAVTAPITVNPLPDAITGALLDTVKVCVGSTVSISDSTMGGSFNVDYPYIATVTTTTGTGARIGALTGLTAGFSTVKYSLTATGCFTSLVLDVKIDSPIEGPSKICFGQTSTFYDGTPGGIWSMGGGVATVDTSWVAVRYDTIGTSITSYTASYAVISGTSTSATPVIGTLVYTTDPLVSPSCTMTKIVTMNPKPATIGFSTTTVCGTDSIMFTDATTNGVWSTTDSAIAYVYSHSIGTGVVVGTWAGSSGLPRYDTIYYTDTLTGCYQMQTVTVNPLALIMPDTDMCVSVPRAFFDTVGSGGTWSLPPTNPNASITGTSTAPHDTATLYGFVAGYDTLSYSTLLGCVTFRPITIYPQPVAITGTVTAVCVGSGITLTDSTLGGHWVSNDTSIARVATGGLYIGIVTGVAPGVANISYQMPSGCFVTYIVTVDPVPSPITGLHSVCGTDTITLSDVSGSGTWSCSPTSLATINPLSGSLVARGVTPGGLVTVTYSIPPNGCYQTYVVTVHPLSAIVGPSTVCRGVATIFTDSTAGGVWGTSSSGIATIATLTGALTGVVDGTVTISYRIAATGCTAYKSLTIDPAPSAIVSPRTYVCIGQTDTLSDAAPGGTWSSHDPTRATIMGIGASDSEGVVTGIATGTVIFTYSFGSGCFVIKTLIVDPLTPIVGKDSVCYMDTIQLTNATPGGIWTTSDTGIAKVSAATYIPEYTGAVLGNSSIGGIDTIYYTLVTGCRASFVVTVNPNPGAIMDSTGLPSGGFFNVCKGDGVTIWSTFPPAPPGFWSVSHTGHIAFEPGDTINPVLVLGLAVGAVTVTYTNASTGCWVTAGINVNPDPDSVRGQFNICVGDTVSLHDYTMWTPSPGIGTWASSSSSIAKIVPGSIAYDEVVVKGVSPGTVTITYFTVAGCTATHLFEVSPIVSPVIDIMPSIGSYNPATGVDQLCAGQVPQYSFTATDTGYSPTYQWFVNGSLKDSGNITFTYAPVASGDIVEVVVVSNQTCARPNTDTARLSIFEVPSTSDAVTISYSPSMTPPMCSGQTLILSATPTGGGTTPAYQWQVNGLNIAGGTNSTYSYTPVNGDVIDCYMMSSTLCATPDPAFSNTVTAVVSPSVVDDITIFAFPSNTVNYYEPVTFTSVSTNYGWAATYQWYVNGVSIPGATDSTFTWVMDHSGDKVYCLMTSSNQCATPSPVTSNSITLVAGNLAAPYVANGFSEVLLVPNPNKGTFRLSGNLNDVSSGDVAIEVTDVLGKIIYVASGQARNGKLDMDIKLPDEIAAGVYYLRITCGDESDVRHFVVDK